MMVERVAGWRPPRPRRDRGVARASLVGAEAPIRRLDCPGPQHPDLNGLWQAINTAHWDIQDHSAQPAPVLAWAPGARSRPGAAWSKATRSRTRPWALAKKQENYKKRMTVDPFDFAVGDPELRCFLPGVPRATYLPFPFQIVQSTNVLLFSYEFADASRLINMETTASRRTTSGWGGRTDAGKATRSPSR